MSYTKQEQEVGKKLNFKPNEKTLKKMFWSGNLLLFCIL